MRIKMRSLLIFLGFAVGMFVIGDIFIFSSVGKHRVRPGSLDDPYHAGNVRFLKRQIKSGRDYLTEGIKTFAEKLYEGDASTGDPTNRYEGVRDSVMDAMEVPGMKKKVLPRDMDKEALNNDMFGELSNVEQLERDLLMGTLREEEEVAPPEPPTKELLDLKFETNSIQSSPEDHETADPGTSEGLDFNWAHIFGFGKKSEETPAGDPTDGAPNPPNLLPGEAQPVGAPSEGVGWGAGSIEVPGVDTKFLSKLSFPAKEDIFQKKSFEALPSELPAAPSGEDLENEWLFSQLKDLADSVPEKPDDTPPAAYIVPPEVLHAPPPPANMDMTTPTNTHNLLSAYGFFSSLFQPLKFAGSTGDDKDDGGWASVGDLDTLGSLADKVNAVMVPGMQQKLVPQQSVMMEQKSAQQEPMQPEQDLPSLEDMRKPEQNIEMVAIPGFENDFFNKYGQPKDSQLVQIGVPESLEAPQSIIQGQSAPSGLIPDVPNIPGISVDFFNKFFKSANAPEEVPAAVPDSAAGAALPAAHGGEPDLMQVPNIPGLTEDFFNKFAKLGDQSEGVAPPVGSDAIQVPNIPGLTDDFFNKFHPSDQPPLDDIKVPNIPGLTDDFFGKYGGRPVDVEQQGPPAPPEYLADSLRVPNIPGLTDEFFNKFGVPKPSEETQISYQEGTRNMEVPEVPGISADFFNKFIHPVARGQTAPKVGMVAESLEDVPGLPQDFFKKYINESVSEEQPVSGQDLREQGFDLPGLDDYLDKYTEDGELLPGEAIPVQSLKESLIAAQIQVPGMPYKVMPDDSDGMAPGLPDVPPSEFPEMDDDSAKSGLLTFLMKAGLSNLLGQKKSELGAGLPVLPPGFNLSMPQEPIAEQPLFEPGMSGNDTEGGFQIRYPSQDEINVQQVLKALMPNISNANDSLGLGDAQGFLSQLEGVIPGMIGVGGIAAQSADMSEELANITAIEDSRIVECNITKSPFWKVAITDRWHTVQDGLMFVYSAYMDDRILGHTAIRILGILEGWEVGMHLKPFCQVWFQDKTKPFVVGATYEWLPGQPIAKFKAVLLTCVYQTRHVEGKPLAVSLTTEPCDLPKFLVKIHTRNETVGIKKTNFTICLTGPMKFGYADIGQFIQWMEFNIMMGVERFVLYNHSMDAALRPYLVHYAKMGYVQLFPWIIPENIPNPLVFLKNLGHLAMINDCLYRNMWSTNYIIFMDIDEMILPRYGHVTFNPMLRNAGCHKKPQAVVQSVFFRREWPNDELFANNQTIVNMGLVGLLKTKRERKIWPPYMRSKYFIKPDEALICNVHAAHSFLSPLDYDDLSCIFDPKEVVLHHYRYWGEVTGNYVVDRRLHEYGDDLINRASSIYEAVLGRKIT